MSELTLSGLIFGVFAMLFVTPYFMAKGVTYFGDEEFPIGKRLICMIPVFNLIYAEIKYYGRIGIVTISDISLIIGVAARFIIWRTMYSNVGLGTISIFIFWGVIAFFFIANMIFVNGVLKDSGAVETGKRITYSILYPLGQLFIGTSFINIIKNTAKEVQTFNV